MSLVRELAEGRETGRGRWTNGGVLSGGDSGRPLSRDCCLEAAALPLKGGLCANGGGDVACRSPGDMLSLDSGRDDSIEYESWLE